VFTASIMGQLEATVCLVVLTALFAFSAASEPSEFLSSFLTRPAMLANGSNVDGPHHRRLDALTASVRVANWSPYVMRRSAATAVGGDFSVGVPPRDLPAVRRSFGGRAVAVTDGGTRLTDSMVGSAGWTLVNPKRARGESELRLAAVAVAWDLAVSRKDDEQRFAVSLGDRVVSADQMFADRPSGQSGMATAHGRGGERQPLLLADEKVTVQLELTK
jgi:hypothetical protein